MRNPDGTPRVCENVWIVLSDRSFMMAVRMVEGLGKLTAGLVPRGDRPTKDGGRSVLRFTFGIYMEKELKEPILIIQDRLGR